MIEIRGASRWDWALLASLPEPPKLVSAFR
jgi:hypothetical protein